MLAWEKNTNIYINMQLTYVQLWSPHFISYNLKDIYLLLQLIWTDIKTIMYYYVLSNRYKRNSIIWLM